MWGVAGGQYEGVGGDPIEGEMVRGRGGVEVGRDEGHEMRQREPREGLVGSREWWKQAKWGRKCREWSWKLRRGTGFWAGMGELERDKGKDGGNRDGHGMVWVTQGGMRDPGTGGGKLGRCWGFPSPFPHSPCTVTVTVTGADISHHGDAPEFTQPPQR